MQQINDIRKRLTETWSTHCPVAPSVEEVQQFVHQSQILDHAEKTNLRTVIFSYHDFAIHHINVGTARYFGSNPEEIIEHGPNYIISCVNPKQAEAAVLNTAPMQHILYNSDPEIWKHYHASYVNCNITCQRGNHHRSLFHAFPVMFDQKGYPMMGMFLIYDLEPFMTGGTWWYRYKIGDRVFLYHHLDGHLQETDILSPRELETLVLISQGASSKEIAAELFLSVNTVDNHRRNMLKKTGAVDTSALIYLCKLCQII